jgi:hypothetical protein
MIKLKTNKTFIKYQKQIEIKTIKTILKKIYIINLNWIIKLKKKIKITKKKKSKSKHLKFKYQQ